MRTRLAIPLAATALAIAACGGEEPGRVAPPSTPIEVVVSSVDSTAPAVAFPARVVSSREVELATRASGLVRRVAVDVGSPVRRGQLLVALESGDVGADVDAAAADVRRAERYHERIAALEADGAATPQELDDAEAQLATARARLRRARTQLAYVHLTAPIDGVVTERRVDPGDLAVPGQPALTLVSPEGIEIEADLPAGRAGTVAPGQEVTVVVPGENARIPARVARVVPALEAGSRRFRVEASFASPGTAGRLMPGAFVRMEVERGGPAVRWMPLDAIVRRGQLTGVFTVENDTLRLRWIRLGERRADAAEVLAGLPAGARLVRRPDPALEDGAPVKAVESETWRLRPLADATAPGGGSR
ncbi:MAG: efflux RND transporter periplasmic adaptor subunit [Gemmatimonadota bacterium]|nr:efflux RND transporter periplasmic adaptor subunit [Gemmatimonadota bacterium]